MKSHAVCFVFFVMVMFSCHSPFTKNKSLNHFDSVVVKAYQEDSITASKIDKSSNGDIDPSAFASLFVLVVDTGKNYSELDQRMLKLNHTISLEIDTMGRYFSKPKNMIILPDSDKDELYAGTYFPRRYPSVALSLEYLDAYTSVAGNKTFALVAGIFENKEKADSMLAVIQKSESSAFVFPSLIYEGCVH